MFEQFLVFLKIASALLAFTTIWLVTIALVFRDLQQRKLHGLEQFLWLAAAVTLPLIGFLIYWVARLLARLLLPQENLAEDPRLRMTMVKPVAAPPAPNGYAAPRPLPTLQAQPEGDPRLKQVDPTSTLPGEAWLPPARPEMSATHYTLVAVEGPYQGNRFPVEAFPARIGRGPTATLTLNADQGISRQHAEIYQQHGQVRIRDLNSTHGTLVNGQPINDAPLNPGDRLKVGISAFLFTDR